MAIVLWSASLQNQRMPMQEMFVWRHTPYMLFQLSTWSERVQPSKHGKHRKAKLLIQERWRIIVSWYRLLKLGACMVCYHTTPLHSPTDVQDLRQLLELWPNMGYAAALQQEQATVLHRDLLRYSNWSSKFINCH
jgi:hypothetical protein